ncbi:thioesterase II family protein [Fischerella thermalis]|uniref:Microcystin synthetase-associated thioesterase n=2 Tax=Fischerella TaxID=1190 RepID=E1U3N5_9CYAN|nr:thioesterase II family protein [Fischerella thermalis]ACN96042.1 microcystin synthetase-associated thioesterase [Fischerella sp. MV11]PMB23830.1 putative thioesterase [Fischerella thermalis CCMEE 5318]PMB34363.1 putative thioesterase [Fischerella thermalis CCMEE 5319]
MNNKSWLANCQLNHLAKLRLFCFPYAGGGAAIFRSWQDFLPTQIEVCPVELPGRGLRLMEAAFTQLIPLVEAIAPALLPYLNKPFALFGHSMGALIAFELACKLCQAYNQSPIHLFISGRAAPHIPERSPIYDLSDAEFLEGLRRLNGSPQEVLDNAEYMQLLIPTLRADFTMADTYTYTPKPPLKCPITAFAGLQDPEASADNIKAWQQYTSTSFSMHLFPGDHFFINTAKQLLFPTLSQELEQSLRSVKI